MLDEGDDIHPLFHGAPGTTEFKKLRKRIVRQTREAIRKGGLSSRGEHQRSTVNGGCCDRSDRGRSG